MSNIDHVAGDGGGQSAGSDKDATLQLVQEEHKHLRQAIAGLDNAQLTQVWFGDWGVKDIIAHVAGWSAR